MMRRESVRDFASGRWRHVLAHFGVRPEVLDGEHHACPVCGGKDRFRFDDKDGRGTWFCNQCGAGDGIQLVIKITGLSFKQAALSVERFLTNAGELPDREFRQKPDAALIKAQLNVAWQQANDPLIPYTYLMQRGVLAAMHGPSRPIDDLRGGHLAYYENKHFVAMLPTMLALVRDPGGRPVSIHRTYMKPDGTRAKKLMRSVESVAGAAVRLRSIEDGTLVVGEGIESTLAGAEQVGSGMGAWALLSAGNMSVWQVPHEVQRLIICADNDRNFVGQAAAFALAKRAAGMPKRRIAVEVIVPREPDSDMLDQAGGRIITGGNGFVRYSNGE
jgi:putative DNA primase/helicase